MSQIWCDIVSKSNQTTLQEKLPSRKLTSPTLWKRKLIQETNIFGKGNSYLEKETLDRAWRDGICHPFPGWYLSVGFLPPIVFGLTYQGEGFRQQLLQCCSALCTRLQLFRQGTCQGGKRMPERHGTAGQLPEVGGFWPNRRIPWILFGVFFFQHNADHTTDIPEGFCGSYESWLVFFFFLFFVLLLVFKVGFSQTRNSQCQTANPKKNTLTLRPPTKFIVGFCFHLLLQSIDGLVGAIRWRLISFCPEEKSCIHEFHIGIHERNFVQPQKKSQTNTWHGLKLSQCKKLTIKKYL